jgi:hypothetical protein
MLEKNSHVSEILFKKKINIVHVPLLEKIVHHVNTKRWTWFQKGYPPRKLGLPTYHEGHQLYVAESYSTVAETLPALPKFAQRSAPPLHIDYGSYRYNQHIKYPQDKHIA